MNEKNVRIILKAQDAAAPPPCPPPQRAGGHVLPDRAGIRILCPCIKTRLMAV